jgi:hypothetical protein
MSASGGLITARPTESAISGNSETTLTKFSSGRSNVGTIGRATWMRPVDRVWAAFWNWPAASSETAFCSTAGRPEGLADDSA